ncbi:glycosyltransferase family 25 protein [Shimia sp. SDUM112013]|uniref:glycosyltransferase family 25 protein n=1 Tax=Shimia sp. SDUM112013 TaxID=3136160 RepID=UPI0032ED5CFF
MHSLIIHMPGSTERRANVDTLLATLPNAEIVDAVDGRLPEVQAATPIVAGTLYRPCYPFPLKGGEVGCFLSHRKCWQKIVDEDWDAALIAEDDLAIDPEVLPALLRLVGRNATPESFIRIPPKDREPLTTVIDREGDLALFTPRRIGLQTTAQVVGRIAAKRLLAATETLDRPVDSFLQMHWVSGQPVQTILPNGARELVFGGGSTVQQKSGNLPQKLLREFHRARYRAAVKRHPQT